jgi:hypothetical protein
MNYELSLAILYEFDDTPMDWVKPKKERTKETTATEFRELGTNGKKKIAAPPKPTSVATDWLESLCSENIEFLKQSLPVAKSRSISNRSKGTQSLLPKALPWGTGLLEVEIDEGPDVLQRLLQAYTKQLLLPGRKAEAKDNTSGSVSQLKVKTCENVAKWLNRSLPIHGSDPFVALTCLTWVYGLNDLGRELSPADWLEALQNILTQVDRSWSEPKSSSLFPWLLWSCEAPLALSTQLSKFRGKDRMVVDALERLSDLLAKAAEDTTPWMEFGSRNLRALIASVFRSRLIADKLGAKAWGKKERKGYAALLETALTLTAPDGQPLLLEIEGEQDDRAVWDAAIELCNNPKSLVAMSQAVLGKQARHGHLLVGGKNKNKSGSKRKGKPVLREIGRYFEKAEIASMRRGWENDGCRLAVDFSREPIWLDCLGNAGKRLISGEWDLKLRKNGNDLVTDVAWSEVCWFSDDDVDYLELEAAVENECRIQRQMILIRQEGWILLSDTLLGNEVANWSIESTFDLGSDIEFVPAQKSHEAILVSRENPKRTEATLLPLSLPEWRRQPSHGLLSSSSGKLTLTHEVHGRRLYSPVMIVPPKPGRSQPFTWRRLTVAEDLQIQPMEVAQAYRVQVGKEQMVLYRSLAPVVRRSALGLHLNSEFYCGRFDPDDVAYESIVEISAN